MKGSSRKYIPHTLAMFLLVVALAVVACGTSATPTPSSKAPPATTGPTPVVRGEETVLKVGSHLINRPPDPAKGGGFQAVQIGVAETLFKLGKKDLRPEPWLATGARQLDEKTWEITLRQGVKFHNGALMDAAAVKASLERASAKNARAKVLLDIARIEVKDPSTLTIVTNRPSPILPAMLAESSSAIVDAAAAEAMGDAFTDKPVLTGPFKVERFQLDKEFVVVRHKGYWGPPPVVDRVIFLYLPDGNSRVLALQSGDIDLAIRVPTESVTTLKSHPNLTVRSAAPDRLVFMHLNHRRDPWKDARVREAVGLAIDRGALVKGVLQGQGFAATGPLPSVVLSCRQLQGHPFDPAKARQFLAQAGYQDKDGDGFVEKDGQTLTMTLLSYPQTPYIPPMAEAIQGSLKAIGVKVAIRNVENIHAALAQADWDGGMYDQGMAFTGDPYFGLSQLFLTGAPGNWGGYSSPQVDELGRQVAAATERQVREQLACSASQSIVDEVGVVPLLYTGDAYGVSRKVVGFDDPHPVISYLIDSQIGKR
jgi:peptide/nickel transport system substrate-binding protein